MNFLRFSIDENQSLKFFLFLAEGSMPLLGHLFIIEEIKIQIMY
jgi:hypothetical protein